MAIKIDGSTYIPAADAARDVGVSRQTLWRWRHARKVPAGRRYRDGQVVFTPAEFDQIRKFAARLEPALP